MAAKAKPKPKGDKKLPDFIQKQIDARDAKKKKA
jgi:hypothetical protein